MFAGRSVRQVWRHRPNEVGIEFTDGSRLYIDSREEDIELSITGVSETD